MMTNRLPHKIKFIQRDKPCYCTFRDFFGEAVTPVFVLGRTYKYVF